MSNTDLRALLAEVDVYLRELYVPAYMRKKRERLCARITAALEDKAIMEAKRPEPVANIIKAVREQGCKHGCGSMKHCICSYAEDLADHVEKLDAYADRMAADAHHYRQKSDMLSDAAFQSEERAEAAERQFADSEEENKRLLQANRDCVDHFNELLRDYKQQAEQLANQHRGRTTSRHVRRRHARLGRG